MIAAGAVCGPQKERYTDRPDCCMAADLGFQDAGRSRMRTPLAWWTALAAAAAVLTLQISPMPLLPALT